MNHFDWYSPYTAALLELNPTKLSTRIHEAEIAISSRVQKLAEEPDSSRELEAIADALSSLRALQRNILRDHVAGHADSPLLNRI
jgi:hypothetical protein